MSSQGSPTLELDVRSRRAEKGVAMLAIAAAAGWPLLSDAAFPLLGMAAAALVAVGFWRAGWMGGMHRITRITWTTDDRWILLDAQECKLEAVLRADTRVGAGWIWLRWSVVDPHRNTLIRASRSMLLMTGDVCRPDLRRLLVRLRIDGPRSIATLARATQWKAGQWKPGTVEPGRGPVEPTRVFPAG